MRIFPREVKVGESATLSLDLQTKGPDATIFSDTDVSSATVFVYEVGDGTYGQVDSGTASTVVDATRTEADDFWNDSFIEFTSGNNKGQIRRVSDFDNGTTTLTLDVTTDPLPATPAADDEYLLLHYPVIPTTDLSGHAQGTVSGNTVSFQMTAANGCTVAPRTIIVLLKVTYSSGGVTDVKHVAWKVKVTGRML